MTDVEATPGCRLMRDVAVPMRDGVRLAATVVLPAQGERFPTILVRTPYNRIGFWKDAVFYASQGYAFVYQDCRGRYDSEGSWYPFTSEAADGFDTQEWIGCQPWCDGRIGMYGASYLAATQWLSAPEGSRYLASLCPMFMAGDYWKRAYYCDGAFSLALSFTWLAFDVPGRTIHSAMLPAYDLNRLFRTLPLMDMDLQTGREILCYRDYVRHAAYDDYWKALSVRHRYHTIRQPVFLIGGWYDYYPGQNFANYLGLLEHAPDEAFRRSHRVVVGPWTHGINAGSQLGEVDFGPSSVVNGRDLLLPWFERTLKGRPAADPEAPIRLFVMGINQWRDEWEWPLARTRFVRYYLRGRGRANTGAGDGRLDLSPPGDEPPDHYTYDPDDPVPTRGGNHSIGPYWPGVYEMMPPGPFDQRPVEERADVLCYTSDPLEEDTEATGPVRVTLYAATSAPDTDFVARLIDVHPDGHAMNLTEGVIRARFRESVWEPPRLIEPGRIYEYTIDLQVMSNVFLRGHRIRLDVTSSNFPLWDRNPNTGRAHGLDAETRPARQTIHHDRLRPSHVTLPVAPPAVA